MANNIVQLEDRSGNNIFPVAGSMAADSITTQMLQDNSVTSDKIDWATRTYSTTEKIVGTDTDGKTIYERTWVASGVSFAAATNNSFNLIASTEPTVPTEIVNAFGHVAGIQYSGGPVIQYGLGAIRIASGSVTWATNVLFSSAGSLQLSVYSQLATSGSGYYRVTVRYKYQNGYLLVPYYFMGAYRAAS